MGRAYLCALMFTHNVAAIPYIDCSAVQALRDLHQEYKSREIQVSVHSLLGSWTTNIPCSHWWLASPHYRLQFQIRTRKFCLLSPGPDLLNWLARDGILLVSMMLLRLVFSKCRVIMAHRQGQEIPIQNDNKVYSEGYGSKMEMKQNPIKNPFCSQTRFESLESSCTCVDTSDYCIVCNEDDLAQLLCIRK